MLEAGSKQLSGLSKEEQPIRLRVCFLPAPSDLCRSAGLALLVVCGACTEQTPNLGLSSEPLPACADPVGSPGAFVDVAPVSGLDFIHSVDGLAHSGNQLYNDGEHLAEMNAGVVAADLDGDGWVDLFFPQSVGASALYWGAADLQFKEAGPEAGLAFETSILTAASAADFDGDGLLDLVTVGGDALHLMHNEGGRIFREVTAEFNMSATPGLGTSTAWADIDVDGDLDLFVGVYGRDSRVDESYLATSWDSLWRNDGGIFTDIASTLPYPGDSDGGVIAAGWRDLDGDGDPDLVQANDEGPWLEDSFFWENLGLDDSGQQQWRDRKAEAIPGPLANPMGMAMRDLDGDGWRDLWFSNIDRTEVFQGREPWSWIDRSADWAAPLPTGRAAVSWSVVALDLDGDGELGLLLTYGPLAKRAEDIADAFDDPRDYLDQPDRFLQPVRDVNGVFGFVAADDVFPEPMIGNARGVAVADFDRNGTPDIIVGNVDAAPSLLVSRCTAAGRLVVELRDHLSSNGFAVGAVVEVEVAGRVQQAEMLGGGPGTFSGSGPVLMFGLGEAERVDRLSVRWPDGDQTELHDLCAHCRIEVSRE